MRIPTVRHHGCLSCAVACAAFIVSFPSGGRAAGRSPLRGGLRSGPYAVGFKTIERYDGEARAILHEAPRGRGREACMRCGTCAAQCAHTVDIARNIEELNLIYM